MGCNYAIRLLDRYERTKVKRFHCMLFKLVYHTLHDNLSIGCALINVFHRQMHLAIDDLLFQPGSFAVEYLCFAATGAALF